MEVLDGFQIGEVEEFHRVGGVTIKGIAVMEAIKAIKMAVIKEIMDPSEGDIINKAVAIKEEVTVVEEEHLEFKGDGVINNYLLKTN